MTKVRIIESLDVLDEVKIAQKFNRWVSETVIPPYQWLETRKEHFYQTESGWGAIIVPASKNVGGYHSYVIWNGDPNIGKLGEIKTCTNLIEAKNFAVLKLSSINLGQ